VGADRDAEIYAKYAEELIRYATSMVGPAEAADVFGEAVVRAFAADSWASVRNPRAYLYRTVLHEAQRHLRRRARRRLREQRTAGVERFELPDVRPEVIVAVGRLSAQQRAVVFLTYWEDLTPVTVAELLGISEGSVRRQLARARARLRRILDE
jgi:RNA polymerase sigma-70 factor (ECF subfamily)